MAAVDGGMWTPFKEILSIIEIAIVHRKSAVYADLDEILTKHRSVFVNLLKNPNKNGSNREQVKKSATVGLKLNEQGNSITLREPMIQDVLLLSDALDLNEISCVELLLAAEQQSSNFPGLNDAAICALLYHDGRRSILAALKLLLTGRPGVTWTLELDERILELITKFTENLISNGLVSIILNILEDLSLPKELKKLEDAHGLSDGKHKNMITELITEQQLILGDCLFALACQYPMDKSDCEKILNHLKLIAPNTADGSLDAVTMRVLFALLANFNCDVLDLAIDNIEDTQYHQLPYFKDKAYFPAMHKCVLRPDDNLWQTSGMKEIIKLCWSIFLRTCSTHPGLSDFEEHFEDDEEVIDSTVTNGVFQFLRKSILESNKFSSEEYFVKLMHSFVTSLIVKFPMKIKDWRNSGDEHARIVEAHLFEGIEPPRGLSHDFKDFMDIISALYKKDQHGLHLNCEYWIPPEPLGGVFSPHPIRKAQQSLDQKKLMLNKFVRLAGDILMQSLYVSYLNMLTSLSNNEQASSYCFRLLSRNERTGNVSLSWDHFFNSLKQYYMSLRSTPDAMDHRMHIHRYQISPEELEGLESVLHLIKCVAENNESVRIAFCENQTWLPVASLLGLVCCSVPPSLKGLLLETLTAFAKSPEVAVSLWHSLEAAQVLQTVESTQKSGIAVELLEIESRNEVYPQTMGFINLIDALTEIAVPATLGAGTRVPGFHPYLEFLTNSVFLTFKTRAYQDSCEKWCVGSKVLHVLLKILKEYNPEPDHFSDRIVQMQGVNLGKASKPSGFQLMVSLLNDTPVLRMLLSIVDDIGQLLEEFVSNEDLKSSVEQIVGYCFAILVQVLEKQAVFLELASSHRSSMIVSPLDELLLSVNTRTGRPDYLFIIARYMTYANIQTSITLDAVKLLKLACEGLRVQKEIVELLSQNEVGARELLVGFAEHLEVPDPESEGTIDDFVADEEEENGEKQDQVRQTIVQLLSNTLNQPSVNLAQFLLGFDIRQSLARTNLQDPGVKGFPKTCLHSIVTILNRGAANAGPGARLLTPKLSESLYRLMYQLCAHYEIGGPVRRYLRTNTDFYMKHIQALPFLPSSAEDYDLDEIQYIRLANQQSWFLKTVAIDLRVVATSRMRSSLQQLLGVLYSEQAVPEVLQGMGNDFTQRTLEASQITVGDSLSRTMLGSAFRFGSDEKSLVLSLLSSVSFTQRYPPNIELQFFDYSAVEQLVTSCEEPDELGTPLCNVRKLYKVLMAEINNSQLVVGASQKQEILKEVKSVLKHAVDRNLVRESFHAKRNCFESWRQVVEITFAVCPSDMIPVEKKQAILMEILEQLMPKLTDDEALPELSAAVAGTILSLMANFWFTCTQIDSMKNVGDISTLPMDNVCSIFPGLVEGIISAGSGQARTRANLYGAFLYFIQIGQMYNSIVKEGDEDDGVFGKNSKESWQTTTMQILYKYGDSFLDIVAKDMCQGTCISRMMGMSVMDAIASLDWKHKYLMLMTSRGYLRVLVDQLLEEDVELQGVLSLQPQSMKPLYLFESKMSFLAKVASTDYGAQTLLQFGLISRLTECQFLDFHVDKPTLLSNNSMTMGYTHSNDPFLPSLLERYSKIFSSFARLMLAFLSSVGIHHQVAISQVQNLVMNHEDLFHTILNDTGETHSMTSLKQLSLAIAIVSLLPITDKRDDAWEILSEEQRSWRTFMNRIHRLMLSLLNKYSIAACKKIMNQTIEAENFDNSSMGAPPNQMSVSTLETQNALLQIRSRALTFCKNVISSQGLSGPYARVLFAPSFTENAVQGTRLVTGKPVSGRQLPNLSLIVEDLKTCPPQLTKCLDHLKMLDRKIDSLQDLPSDELREIILQEPESERLPFHQRQVVALRILRKLKELRQNEANLFSYIIEHAVYILWRHIDYYYMHCVPTDGSFMISDTSRSTHSRARHLNASISEYSSPLRGGPSANQSRLDQTLPSSVNKNEINDLKVESPKILSDKLWQTVLDADKVYVSSRSRLSFLSSLVRRIQSIIKLNS